MRFARRDVAVKSTAVPIVERLREEQAELSSPDDCRDFSIDYAAGVLAFAALGVCLRIVWDVPIYITVIICYPLMMLYGSAFDQDINKAKKPSDKLPPGWEL
jgi:hypothetical protein